MLEIFIDGACSGNPGDASIGVVINSGKKNIKEISQSIGEATNNIAEYSALIYALQEALILKEEEIKVYTDSELVYKQIKGLYKIKNQRLKPFYLFSKHLISAFNNIDIIHIPREKNKKADNLAKKALKGKQVKMVASLFNNSEEESPSSKG